MEAIRAVMGGGSYLADEGAQRHLERLRSAGTGEVIALTPREREVLQLHAEGLTTKQVAHKLQVSAKTIESHRSHLMIKRDTHTVADLIKHAAPWA